jgi:hypothetical protein
MTTLTINMKRSICALGADTSFLLDGVLGGHDDERIGQRVALFADRHRRSCIASSSALCTLAGAR